jgi:hypothetical protein
MIPWRKDNLKRNNNIQREFKIIVQNVVAVMELIANVD